MPPTPLPAARTHIRLPSPLCWTGYSNCDVYDGNPANLTGYEVRARSCRSHLHRPGQPAADARRLGRAAALLPRLPAAAQVDLSRQLLLRMGIPEEAVTWVCIAEETGMDVVDALAEGRADLSPSIGYTAQKLQAFSNISLGPVMDKLSYQALVLVSGPVGAWVPGGLGSHGSLLRPRSAARLEAPAHLPRPPRPCRPRGARSAAARRPRRRARPPTAGSC